MHAYAELPVRSEADLPVWLPIRFLLIEALRKYHRYYGDDFRIECPTGSGQLANLDGVAHELAERLGSLFVPKESRPRLCHGSFARYADDPHWRDFVLFCEYFDGDTGRGLGASHQTGRSAVIGPQAADVQRKRNVGTWCGFPIGSKGTIYFCDGSSRLRASSGPRATRLPFRSGVPTSTRQWTPTPCCSRSRTSRF